MSAAAIFTRRVMGMDYRVWLVMPAIWVLSLAFLGYKYLNDKPCALATINLDGKPTGAIEIRYVHQLIKFEIQTEDVKNVQWQFKDVKQRGLVVYHKFTKEGEYNVIATVNGACTYKQKVKVESRDNLNDQEMPEFQIFQYPDKSTYSKGESIRFESVRINIQAKSYEWKLLETNETQSDAVATFSFNNPGDYTIQLILNNDPSIIKTRKIKISADVLSLPVESDNPIPANGGLVEMSPGRLVPPEENSLDKKRTADSTKETRGVTTGTALSKPVIREVKEEAFKEMLQSVVNDEKEIESLFEFLAYKESTLVEINGDKNGAIPLKDFCKKMKAKRKNKRKIESLSFLIENNNSIQRIKVQIPEKVWWWPF